MMHKFHQLLILGDFNIHVYCPEKPLAKDFLNLIDTFNLARIVSDPTQERGHTPDLVLTHSFTVLNLEVCGAASSDHMPCYI